MDENERLATLVALNECSGRLDSATKGMESIAKWFDTWSGAIAMSDLDDIRTCDVCGLEWFRQPTNCPVCRLSDALLEIKNCKTYISSLEGERAGRIAAEGRLGSARTYTGKEAYHCPLCVVSIDGSVLEYCVPHKQASALFGRCKELEARLHTLEQEVSDRKSQVGELMEDASVYIQRLFAESNARLKAEGRLDSKEMEINRLMRQYDRVSSEKFTAEDAFKAAEARLASIRVAATELLTAVASDDGPSYEDVVRLKRLITEGAVSVLKPQGTEETGSHQSTDKVLPLLAPSKTYK